MPSDAHPLYSEYETGELHPAYCACADCRGEEADEDAQ